MKSFGKTAAILYVLLLWRGLCLPGHVFSQEAVKNLLSPESSSAPLRNQDLSVENLRAKKAEIDALLKEVKEEVDAGLTKNFYIQKENKLNELRSLYSRQEVLLARLLTSQQGQIHTQEEVAKAIKSLEKKVSPNSFLFVAAMEEEMLIATEQFENQQALAASLKVRITEQRQILETNEEKRRFLKEKVTTETLPGSPEAQNLELAQLNSRIAEQRLRLRDIEEKNAQAVLATFKTTKELLRAEIEDRKDQTIFDEETLTKLQAGIDQKLKELNKVITQAKATFDRLEAAESQSESPLSVNMERMRFRFGQARLDTLRARRSLLEQKRTLWEFRFQVLNDKLTNEEISEGRKKYQVLEEQLEHNTIILNERLLTIIRERTTLTLDMQEQLLTSKEKKILSTIVQLVRDTALAIGEHIGEIKSALHMMDVIEEEAGAKIEVPRPVLHLLSSVWYGTKRAWTAELWSIDDSPITVGKIIIALFLFIVGLGVSRFLAWKMGQKLLARLRVASGVAIAAQTITYYLLIILFTVAALKTVHIPLTIFTLLGGALAIGVGFGSQNIVNNFFSGLILLFEQPIRVGDIIEFAGTRGTVAKIGTRSTLITTPDNLEVIVPNSALVENNVINWTLGNRSLRRSISVGVAYGSPTREVAKLLIKAVEEHGGIQKNPSPEVFFRDFGDSALVFEVRYWVTIIRFTEVLRIESDLRHVIDGLFREAGITIPFPQRDLHLDLSSRALRVELGGQDDLDRPPAGDKVVGG